jgi:hypothetical protein
MAVAVLTAILVTREQERVGNLPAELAWDVHEANEPDHGRTWHLALFGAEDAGRVRLEDFGLAVDDETERSPEWKNGERLERRIQCETANQSGTSFRASPVGGRTSRVRSRRAVPSRVVRGR